MIDELVTAYGNRFLVAALGVSLALLCLFIVLWLLRNRAPSPFVRGGRNRQPRLQVLDAAAVDARRRLVLVRRDNVEHLVMIGGPTDIVIESGIGDERAYLSATTVQSAPLQVPAEVAPVAVAAPVEARALPQREAAPATTAPIEAPVSVRPATVPAATPAPAPVPPPLPPRPRCSLP
ncbi:flagellar biosynthetic protein FliO [Rhizobium sp. CAU 1783]